MRTQQQQQQQQSLKAEQQSLDLKPSGHTACSAHAICCVSIPQSWKFYLLAMVAYKHGHRKSRSPECMLCSSYASRGKTGSLVVGLASNAKYVDVIVLAIVVCHLIWGCQAGMVHLSEFTTPNSAQSVEGPMIGPAECTIVFRWQTMIPVQCGWARIWEQIYSHSKTFSNRSMMR